MAIAIARREGQLPNEVDVLTKRIKEIQKACEHEWERLDRKGFNEVHSNFALIVLAGKKTYRGTNPIGKLYQLITICKKCNSTYNWDAKENCFQCFGPLGLNLIGKENYIFDTIKVIDDREVSGIYCHVHRKHCKACDIYILYNVVRYDE